MKASSRLNSTSFDRVMLPDCIKALLAPYFPELDLEDIRIRESIPWYVPMNAAAYTNRNHIYFAPGCYDTDSLAGIAMIAHELTHCAQYKNHGVLRFRVLYISSWLAELWGQRSFDQAYSRNRFEVAARELEERVCADLSNRRI
jgi:Domain of unknown function (DUF4157)